ncbi:MAG: CHRD domain-containing protein [Myxococcaceae bacterium]|nr:CHRD domain-containing protein [Myxococcaceae bacterium]
MLQRLAVVGMVVGLWGCNEECVDAFDCAKVPSRVPLTCDDGRCVAKTTLPMFPSFGGMDAGRRDGGVDGGASDGGAPEVALRPGEYTARLSGGQLVPPVATSAAGSAQATLVVDDAGVATLSWSAMVMNATPVGATLLFDAPAGRSGAGPLVVSDGGSLSGTLALTRAQAAAVSTNRASLVIATTERPAGGLKGQLAPRGALVGFTQLVRAANGQYGGGGQLVLEFMGMFPTAGGYDFEWPESGRVTSAALVQGAGSTPLLALELNGSRTGASGTFEPLPLLLMIRDGGLFVTGTGADGGEVFRGDLSLSLR